MIATNTCGAQRVMGILLSTGPATSSQRLDLRARASDLPAELVQTSVNTGHRRRETNGERRIFIVARESHSNFQLRLLQLSCSGDRIALVSRTEKVQG